MVWLPFDLRGRFCVSARLKSCLIFVIITSLFFFFLPTHAHHWQTCHWLALSLSPYEDCGRKPVKQISSKFNVLIWNISMPVSPFSLDFSEAVILLFPLTKNIKQKTTYIQPFGCTPLQRTLGISCLLKVLVCCSFHVIFEKIQQNTHSKTNICPSAKRGLQFPGPSQGERLWEHIDFGLVGDGCWFEQTLPF